MTRFPALQLLALSLLLAPATVASQTAEPKSLPYVAVHDPEFIAASQATFMQGDDRLIGIAERGTVKAYPAAILSQHGLVEDDSPSGTIAVTW
jgi:Protein of unknown function (DUF3179)